MKVIILAGGGGTRLWPLSRQSLPKQFLTLFHHHGCSLLTNTIQRALCCVQGALNDIYICTSDQLIEQVLSDIHQLPGSENFYKNVLMEPFMRNTAPAVSFTARHIYEKFYPDLKEDTEQEILAIFPADHYIEDLHAFKAHLLQAETLAKQGYIVTLGVEPTKPETGYGYIEIEDPLWGKDWFPIKRFVEKPTLDKAKAYLASQQYLWNTGIFVLSLKTLFQSLNSHAPEILDIIQNGFSYSSRYYSQMPDISFDYAVMEKARNAAVVPFRATWSDVGSWDSLYDLLPKDSLENIYTKADTTFFHQSRGCMVRNESDRIIGLIGMNDCYVIDTPDALLIGHKGSSQEVKSIVSFLSQAGHPSICSPAAEICPWGEIIRINHAQQRNGTPVYQVGIKPHQSISLTTFEHASLQVVDGCASLQFEGKLQVIRYPHFATLQDSDVIYINTDLEPLTLLIVGGKPCIQPGNEMNRLLNNKIPNESVVLSSIG